MNHTNHQFMKLSILASILLTTIAHADLASSGLYVSTNSRKVPVGDFLWMNNYYYKATASAASGTEVLIRGKDGKSVRIPFAKAPEKVRLALESDREALAVKEAVEKKARHRAAWQKANSLEVIRGEVTQVLAGGCLLMEMPSTRIYYVSGLADKAQGDRAEVAVKRTGVFRYVTVNGADATVPSMQLFAWPAGLE